MANSSVIYTDVTSTLTDIIIEGICTQSLLLDSFITIHAGVIACLYKIIGVEIGKLHVLATRNQV